MTNDGTGLGEGRGPGHLIPNPESFGTKSSVIGGGEQVASRAEMRSNDSVNLDKPLSMPSGFESSHSSLPFACGLMRVLRSVVQIPVLPMRNAGHHDWLRRSVAA
jgi:hypothetical protein